MITVDRTAPDWAHDFARQVDAALAARRLPEHSIDRLPKAFPPDQMIVVPDATAGRVLCLSDGTDWLELSPVGVVS